MAINTSTSKIDISLILTAFNNASAPLAGVRKQLDDIGASSRATEQRLRAIQVVIAGILVNRAIELGKSFITTTANVEQLRLRLGLAIGSIEEAGRLVEELDARFTKAGADANRITEAMASLAEAGFSVDEAKSLAEAIGLVALTGKDAEQTVSSVADAFVKLSVRGTADVRTLVGQLSAQMPRAINIMAAEMGRTVAEFKADVQSGAVTAQEIIDVFVTGANRRLGDITRVQSNSVRGAMTLLANFWEDNIRNISRRTDLNNEIVDRLQSIRATIDGVVSRVTVDHVREFFTTLDNVANAATKVATAVAPMVAIVAKFGSTAAEQVSKLPSEVVGAGLIGYLFFGRLGAAVLGTITYVLKEADQLTEERKNTIMRSVEQALPYGLIGYVFLGPSGAVVFTAIAAIISQLDQILNDVAKQYPEIEQAAQQYGNAVWKSIRQLFGVPQLLGNLKKDLETAWSALQEKMKGVDLGLDGVTGEFNEAVNKRRIFVQGLNNLDPSIKSNVESGTAMSAVLEHWNELVPKLGDGLNKTAEEARKLDQNVAAAASNLNKGGVDVEKFAKSVRDLGTNLGDPRATEQFKNELNAALDKVSEKTRAATETYNKYAAAVRGDGLTQNLSEIRKKYAEHQAALVVLRKEVEDFAIKYRALPEVAERVRGIQSVINGEIARAVDLRSAEENKARALHAILQDRLLLEQRVLQLRSEQQKLELQQTLSNDPLKNFFSGTSGGQVVNQVEQQRVQLRMQMAQYEQQINAEQEKRLNTNNPQLIAQIDQTIESYKSLRDQTQGALEGLSSSAASQRQLWQNVGQIVETGLGDALYGVVTKTRSLKDVGVQVYNALTQAASRYIAQLIMMKAFSTATSLFGFGGPPGAGAGGRVAAANGAGFSGTIQPFASGGVISGPTLFGIAGEAFKKEAIMPLENVGGKLGVRAAGAGGGGSLTLNLNAIDAASGIEFLMKNMDYIAAGLDGLRTLNRSERTR